MTQWEWAASNGSTWQVHEGQRAMLINTSVWVGASSAPIIISLLGSYCLRPENLLQPPGGSWQMQCWYHITSVSFVCWKQSGNESIALLLHTFWRTAILPGPQPGFPFKVVSGVAPLGYFPWFHPPGYLIPRCFYSTLFLRPLLVQEMFILQWLHALSSSRTLF